jgi:hypothetical protein
LFIHQVLRAGLVSAAVGYLVVQNDSKTVVALFSDEARVPMNDIGT